MAKAYSRYTRCGADPLYRSDREREQLLLYPLFMTSFLIDDLLADNGEFGAEQVVVSSASSNQRQVLRVVGTLDRTRSVEGVGGVDGR